MRIQYPKNDFPQIKLIFSFILYKSKTHSKLSINLVLDEKHFF